MDRIKLELTETRTGFLHRQEVPKLEIAQEGVASFCEKFHGIFDQNNTIENTYWSLVMGYGAFYQKRSGSDNYNI